MERTCIVTIPADMQNLKDGQPKEQYTLFQRDGVTLQIPLGKVVEVPEWVAVRAKEIGLIEDYLVK